jgi:prepilin-type N-terminal cleavage/methylation domain-containing protein
MTKGKYTKGFTLVELLVVIAIIAVLAGALFMVINPARLLAKTRDSTRIAEITEVNKAIAAALADGRIVLAARAVNATDNTAANRVVTGTGWVGFTPATGTTVGLGDYLPSLPDDPRTTEVLGTGTYHYRFTSTLLGWKLGAYLESLDNAALGTNDGGTQNTCTTMPALACSYEVGTILTLAI